ALEDGAELEPLARSVPLVALARGLSVPGPDTAADALPFFAAVGALMNVVQLHQIDTPRRRAIFSLVRSFLSASIAALTKLSLLFDPKLLVRISLTPADSTTALTAPPAITPVPGAAGKSRTLAAP